MGAAVLALSAFQGEREGTHRISDGEGEVGADNGSGVPHLTLPSPPRGAERV
jgi:hypothetical protein